jgi:type 1 glutamine amidotransferase
MNRFGYWMVLLSLVGVALPLASCSQQPARLLYLTHSAGFKHGVLEFSEQVIAKIGKDSGVYDATCLAGYRQAKDQIDLSFLTPEYIKSFDAIVLYTTGELPMDDTQKAALVDFVKDGGALIGIHSATDTFYEWPAYKEMMGAYFKTHGVNDKPVTIRVLDKKHPATRMLGDEWVIADEIYLFRQPVPRDKFHILLEIDTAKTADLAAHKMEPGKTYDVAWCREYGKGRVFYTSLGHRKDVWENPKYQAHLLGGIQWALGRAPGDATPTAKE